MAATLAFSGISPQRAGGSDVARASNKAVFQMTVVFLLNWCVVLYDIVARKRLPIVIIPLTILFIILWWHGRHNIKKIVGLI